MNEQDPSGFYYPDIIEISDISSADGHPTLRDPALGTALSTGRTVRPGERVSLRCRAFDRHGRDLQWWLHQYDGSRHSPVVGDDVVLTWDVDAAAVGESVYLGIGMAADTHHRRQGGRDEQGYDGWVVLFYRVAPASGRWSSVQVLTGGVGDGAVALDRQIGQPSRVN